MAQQTTVDILKKQLRDSIYHIVDNDDFFWFDSLFEQAKEMEKQKHKYTWYDSRVNTHISFEQYYNETYNK